MNATEFLIRVGFVCGDYTDPAFESARQLPFVLDRELMVFQLQSGFAYPLLIGMDVIGGGNPTIRREGEATFRF